MNLVHFGNLTWGDEKILFLKYLRSKLERRNVESESKGEGEVSTGGKEVNYAFFFLISY